MKLGIGERERGRERERERETDRQTDRQTDGLTDGRTDGHTVFPFFHSGQGWCVYFWLTT